MDVIDEQGRIFGLVNIIDALVVLLVAAVVIAGVALVLQGPQAGGSGDTETRYATIAFGYWPADIAQAIATGDRVRFADGGTGDSATKAVNVTDVYRVPGPNGEVFVVARVAMAGRVQDGSFLVEGQPVRAGRAAAVVGDTYELNGTVVSLARSGERLPTGETPIVVEATVPTAVASTIHEGDTYRVGNVSGGTVESVTVFPTSDPDERRIQIGVQLRTLSTGADPQFAGRPVRVGQNLTLAPGDASITGTIVARDSIAPSGERADVTVQVAWHNVTPAVANDVTAGTTEQFRGSISARVVGKRVTPETVIVRTENGTLHARDHPRRLNVTLTVDVAARRTDDGLLFHGRRLQVGRTVVLDFGTVTVRGLVIAIGPES